MITNAPGLLLQMVAYCGLVGFQSNFDLYRRDLRGQVVKLRVPELTWVRRLGVSYRRDA